MDEREAPPRVASLPNGLPREAVAAQNESPPSTSIVRELK